MSPNRAILTEKPIRLSSLAAAQPWIILSRLEPLNASGSRRACRMAISRNPHALIALPDFSDSPKRSGMVSPGLSITTNERPNRASTKPRARTLRLFPAAACMEQGRLLSCILFRSTPTVEATTHG